MQPLLGVRHDQSNSGSNDMNDLWVPVQVKGDTYFVEQIITLKSSERFTVVLKEVIDISESIQLSYKNVIWG